MPFDYVFEGTPTLGIPSGPALGVDISTGTLYVSNAAKGTWSPASGTTPFSAVTSGTNSAASLIVGSGASLSTSGTGTISATPAGSDTQIQYNKAGKFGADANFVWNYATEELFIDNSISSAGTSPAVAIGTPLASPIFAGGLMLTGPSTGTEAAELEIHNNFATGIEIFTHANSAFRAPVLNINKSRGTQTSPLAVLSADTLGYINFQGYTGSAYTAAGASIEAFANENWSSSANGVQIKFFTTPNGSPAASNVVSLTLNSDGLGGASTGFNLTVGTGGSSATLILHNTASPTSVGTAGTTGQITWDSTHIYVCTAGGIAGSATWKAATLSAV